jgi:hypothetical protein
MNSLRVKVNQNISKECVPVRCINCVDFGNVMDLWHYSAIIAFYEQGDI